MRGQSHGRGRIGAEGFALRFVRFTATLLLFAFGWRVSGAFVTPCNQDERAASNHEQPAGTEAKQGDGCCPHKGAEPADEASVPAEPHDGDGCSCPIHCDSCCDGAVMFAVAPQVPTVVLGFAEIVELAPSLQSSTRSDAKPRGILHVPRLS